MPRQILTFMTPSAVRIEAHVRVDAAGIEIDLLFNPPREPAAIVAADPAGASDLLEPLVRAHLDDHAARLTTIRIRHDDEPLSALHLGRYGVPLLPEE